MTDARTQMGTLAKAVLVLGILLMIAGIVWHGVSVENIERVWNNLLARPTGPLKFRFILQPTMAAIIAIREGLSDARSGRSPFAWTIISNADERGGRLREGLNATAKIILFGLAMDTIYQVVVFNAFYPYEALLIALLLAFVPYFVIRGLAARIARKYRTTPENLTNATGKD